MTDTPKRVRARTYRFGPLEQRGVLLGWRGGQIVVVLVGVLSGLALLHSVRGPAGAGGAAALVLSALVAAWMPLCGRTAEQWAPAVTRWVGVALAQWLSTDRRLPAPVVRGVEGSRAGVLHDPAGRAVSVVLALGAGDFTLAAPDSKDQQVARWSSVLAALARPGSLLERVQWLSFTVPADERPLWIDFGRRAVLDDATPARRSYAELLGSMTPSSVEHHVILVLRARADRAVSRRARSPDRGPDSATSRLLREADQVAGALREAGVAVDRVLDPDQLHTVLARSWSSRPPQRGLTSAPGDLAGVRDRPNRTDVRWTALRTDDLWHASFWIAEWPRIDIGPEFLAPLLLGNDRSVLSVVMEPVDPRRALRSAQRARTADRAESELRRRGGFMGSARRGREAETVVRRESELADGHGAYRYCGYLRVSATSPERLEGACEASAQAAARAGIEVRRLTGEQDRGFLATLPLGVGVR